MRKLLIGLLILGGVIAAIAVIKRRSGSGVDEWDSFAADDVYARASTTTANATVAVKDAAAKATDAAKDAATTATKAAKDATAKATDAAKGAAATATKAAKDATAKATDAAKDA
jgi:colicin import membrane protein